MNSLVLLLICGAILVIGGTSLILQLTKLKINWENVLRWKARKFIIKSLLLRLLQIIGHLLMFTTAIMFCIVTSYEEFGNHYPSPNGCVVPIIIETKYLPFGTKHFFDEEITSVQFDEIMKNNLEKLESFIDKKIAIGKTNPKAEMIFRY